MKPFVQASPTIRKTPFGDRAPLRASRSSPFDGVPDYSHPLPVPLGADEIVWLQGELARFDLVRENIVRYRKQVRRRRAKILYRAVGRLTWSLVRLAVSGIAARLIEMVRRRTLRLAFRQGAKRLAARQGHSAPGRTTGGALVIRLPPVRSRRGLWSIRRRA